MTVFAMFQNGFKFEL